MAGKRIVPIRLTENKHRTTAAKLREVLTTVSSILALLASRYGKKHGLTKYATELEGKVQGFRMDMETTAGREYPEAKPTLLYTNPDPAEAGQAENLSNALATPGDGVGMD